MISAIRSASPGSLASIHRAQRAYTQSVERLNMGRTHEPDQVARSVKRESQLREVIQRRLNHNQWRSLFQTADAALNEITPALYRLHELALRGLNGMLSEEERSTIHNEARGLESLVNANVSAAQFNERPLFDTDLNVLRADEDYRLETALNYEPVLRTQVPNDDHEIVLIFDSSRSLKNIDELFDKVVEAAQRYQLKGGEVSIGVAFAPITLTNRHGQVPGLRDMVYHPPVNIIDDPQGANLKSLEDFLNDYDFGAGSINFGEAIRQVHDQTEWRAGATQSLIIVSTAGGENKKDLIIPEIERFMDAEPQRRVSAIGVSERNNNQTSTYFSNLIEQLDSGVYHDYSDDLAFDDMVTAASGETRLIPRVNLSSTLYAEDTMALVEDALDKVIAARGQLGALERRAEATVDRHFGDESTIVASRERGEVLNSRQALAQRITSEFQLQRAVHYQRAEHVNHWRRFLDLVNAHT